MQALAFPCGSCAPLPALLKCPFHHPCAPLASPASHSTRLVFVVCLLYSEPFPSSLLCLRPCYTRNSCPELS